MTTESPIDLAYMAFADEAPLREDVSQETYRTAFARSIAVLRQHEAEQEVLRVRGSWDAPGFDACVKAEVALQTEEPPVQTVNTSSGRVQNEGGIEHSWHPIETAPRNGCSFIGYWCDSIVIAVWNEDCANWQEYPDGDFEDVAGEELTHWMPLPSPPVTAISLIRQHEADQPPVEQWRTITDENGNESRVPATAAPLLYYTPEDASRITGIPAEEIAKAQKIERSRVQRDAEPAQDLVERVAKIIAGPYPDETDRGNPPKAHWEYCVERARAAIAATLRGQPDSHATHAVS